MIEIVICHVWGTMCNAGVLAFGMLLLLRPYFDMFSFVYAFIGKFTNSLDTIRSFGASCISGNHRKDSQFFLSATLAILKKWSCHSSCFLFLFMSILHWMVLGSIFLYGLEVLGQFWGQVNLFGSKLFFLCFYW